MQTIFFLHPPWGSLPSGGNKFNRRIVAMARRSGFPLRPRMVGPSGSIDARHPVSILMPGSRGSHPQKPLRIWDSLLMPRYEALSRGAGEWNDAFLMHYLPSLSPRLDPSARVEARGLEDRIAERTSFFLVTGCGLAAVLRERYPGIASFVCEPGVDACFSRVHRRVSGGRSDRAVHLLSVANLLQAKGYRELLAMLQTMNRRHWCWHIVGGLDAEPEFTEEFLRGAADLIDSGRIVFHGILNPLSLGRLMSRMDLFVSASHVESYGMALAEAIAAGLPVVATQVGEASRIAGGRCDVHLVPVGCWDDFSARLATLLDDPKPGVVPLCPAGPASFRSWRDAFADFSSACNAGSKCLGR